MENNKTQEDKFENNQQRQDNENYTHYSKFSPEEQYQYCLKQYDNLVNFDNRQKFKKSLHMRYFLNNNYHNFYYDYDMDKFLLNSNESETAEHIHTLNQMIMHLRVKNIGPESINWIHPLYCIHVQYLSDNSEWKSISDFN